MTKESANKAIATIKKHGSSEDFTIKKVVFRKLSKYSKDKFQCNCCKKFFLPHFLAIDHIHGRKEISKDKELLKIGYKESRNAKVLAKWISKHFENDIIYEHFQILCHNCNVAKFLYKTCPHQKK